MNEAKRFEVEGVTLTVKSLAEKYSLSENTVRGRLSRGAPLDSGPSNRELLEFRGMWRRGSTYAKAWGITKERFHAHRKYKHLSLEEIFERYGPKDGTGIAVPAEPLPADQQDGYHSWFNMKRRCNSPSDSNYKNYGGRGISVCDRWVGSFALFMADMGPRPEGFTIERVDNDGDYCPGNCRWATYKEQAQNTRRSVNLEFKGQVKTINEWDDLLNFKESIGVSVSGVVTRIDRGGMTVLDAFTLPRNTSHDSRLVNVGNITDSISGWARRKGMSGAAIKARLAKGISLDTPTQQINVLHKFFIGGKESEEELTVADISARFDLGDHCVRNRLASGLDMDVPVRGKREFEVEGGVTVTVAALATALGVSRGNAAARLRKGGGDVLAPARATSRFTIEGEVLTVSQIAAKYNLSTTTVRDRLARGGGGSLSLESNKKPITFMGMTKSKSEWSKFFGIAPSTLTYRLKKGMSMQEICDAYAGGLRG